MDEKCRFSNSLTDWNIKISISLYQKQEYLKVPVLIYIIYDYIHKIYDGSNGDSIAG